MKKRYQDRHSEPKQEFGPKGRLLCRFCRVEVSGRRKTFCSDKCVHEFLIRKDGSYARKVVLGRDKGFCALCGLDCVDLSEHTANRFNQEKADELTKMGFKVKLVSPVSGTPYYITQRPMWHMDHIVPVIEGGGSCGLENLRTLCLPCHKKETAALARRRAGK